MIVRLPGKAKPEKIKIDINSVLYKRITWSIFASYIIFLIFKLFFDGPYRFAGSQRSYNLIPLETINSMIARFNSFPNVFMINIAGNVAAFVPLGFFVPMLFQNINVRTAFIIGVIASSTAELIQLVTITGSLDIDDVLLNTIGTMLGFAAYLVSARFLVKQK